VRYLLSSLGSVVIIGSGVNILISIFFSENTVVNEQKTWLEWSLDGS
jgi:hypothetical protein